MDRIPCRASVELRQHQADADSAEKLTPNFADEEDLADLVTPDLREPLAALFATRDEIRMCRESFGTDFVNYRKALDGFLRDLGVLERALRRQWDAS